MGVGQDLDLDVPRAVDEPLDEQRVVAEGGRRLPPGAGQRLGAGPPARATSRMPLPPPPAEGLISTG